MFCLELVLPVNKFESRAQEVRGVYWQKSYFNGDHEIKYFSSF